MRLLAVTDLTGTSLRDAHAVDSYICDTNLSNGDLKNANGSTLVNVNLAHTDINNAKTLRNNYHQ